MHRLNYIVTVDGVVIPLCDIISMSNKQFKDEDGVACELKYDNISDSSHIYVKTRHGVFPCNVNEEWIRPFLDYGRSTYDYGYVKYVIFHAWVNRYGGEYGGNCF